MSPKCLPPSFGSIWLTVREQITTEDFQDDHRGSHLGHCNKMILAILNLHVTQMPPTKFWLNLTYHLGADVVWRFPRWLPEYRNRMILAILNLYVALIPPIKFQLNPTYGLGDFVWRISRWLPWLPSWMSKCNHLSNSQSQRNPNASHQVSAQSDIRFCRCWSWPVAKLQMS